jgi:hypothetical protein
MGPLISSSALHQRAGFSLNAIHIQESRLCIRANNYRRQSVFVGTKIQMRG